MEQQDKTTRETYIKILQAGKEVLNQKDYYEAVVEEIAQKAQVAKGTVFFYFKTKENLFREILLSLIDDLCVIIDSVLVKQTSPIEKLKNIYDEFIEFQLKNVKLFHGVRKALADVEPKVDVVKQKLLDITRKILPLVDEMFRKGLIKKIDTSLDFVEIAPSMLLMYASAVSSAVFFYPEKLKEIKEVFWKILLHGILNEDVSIKMEVFNEQV
ncbi:MAG: TetR/AcrR family transcriptional regulator [Endomicrobia bacterium]|nr:TetR/AcrR family transcriptional regulator [Endomicrobiia bacterium]MDW8056339.1 TetR/AcrR family transcriptional regulator [Elusimicrobiota bacterium]